ncbi:hypothetical protein HID58_031959 [Brassica napus]|uniref:UMP-CMP kinase n=4 Tax=Brassica TaxID=3705 RepID=A0ABQ8BV27_BRANA|nr:hypothetical protein HID58_031959 [Brassica napus]
MADEVPSLAESKLTALVVDDNFVNQTMHHKLLDRLGIKNDVVCNGQEAVDVHCSGRNYDLILMDMEMPILNGIQATKRLREMGIESKIAGVTTRANEGDKKEFMEAGLNDFQEKPLTISKLLSILHRLDFHVQTYTMGSIADAANKEVNGTASEKRPAVIFVLGGPGSGKGTQCAYIVDHFGYTHLSAGDLLRAEIKSGSENGTMIQNMIKEGKIVPSEVTIKLLQKAIQENGNDKFLIDGFPRNEENRAAFEKVTGIEPKFVLFFDCPEEEMERRLLGRNQGREDDNIETIRKRFKVFLESSLPVIQYYEAKGKVRKIHAAKPIEDVFQEVKAVFSPEAEKVKRKQ